MVLQERLDEDRACSRNDPLPDDLHKTYKQIMTFVDAGMKTKITTNLTGELASILQCNLDVLFQVAKTRREINLKKLLFNQI
ncbi:MAG: hypothetical protein ABEJ65_03785 [bacterium]